MISHSKIPKFGICHILSAPGPVPEGKANSQPSIVLAKVITDSRPIPPPLLCSGLAHQVPLRCFFS